MLDGIDRPFVLDRGLWQGGLGLIILEAPPRRRAFGALIRCEIYLAVEEMIYSVADHGEGTAGYDGTIYLKEAASSRALNAFETIDPLRRKARQFLFVGSDFCYETIGFEEPRLLVFEGADAAYEWRPDAQVGLRA